MKRCSRCGIEKELSEFNKRASKKDGYHIQCRMCANQKVVIGGKRKCNTCHIEKDIIHFKKKNTYAHKCNDCFIKENGTKTCNICKIEKDINNFEIRKDNGRYRGECKECKKEKHKKWENNNLDYIKEYRKNYRLDNIQMYKEKDKIYYLRKKSNLTPKIKPPKQTTEERREKERIYYANNKERLQKRNYEWHKEKIKKDTLFALIKRIRSSIAISFKRNGYTKRSRTHEILGCSYEEFKIYLESKFEFWMTWENKGLYNGKLNYGWDIDHIIPVSLANTEEELIKLNHYTNLQPLCSKINRDIKRDIYETKNAC
jgi:hypothetical protein